MSRELLSIMSELTYDNIEQISIDVRRQEISFSNLADELIDHLCCDVEQEMSDGLSFTEAYARVKQRMGRGRLKEIQKDTLYAVDKKYRIMKKTMKISGLAGTILFGTAAVFKIQHWPAAGILLTLGALILGFIFMPSTLAVFRKESTSRNRLFLLITAFLAGFLFIMGTTFKVQHWEGGGVLLSLAGLTGLILFLPAFLINRYRNEGKSPLRHLYIIGAAGLVLYVTGMFFRIQHWPYGQVLLFSAIVVLCLILFPLYAWITWKGESHITPAFLFLLIGFIVIIIPGALINLNLEQSYEYGFYVQQDRQHQMFNYLYESNENTLESEKDASYYSVMQQLHKGTIGLIGVIDSIGIRMVKEAEEKPDPAALATGNDEGSASLSGIAAGKLSRPFNMLSAENNLTPGCPSLKKIEAALDNYKMLLSGLLPGTGNGNYSKLTELPGIFNESDQERFPLSLITGLHSLELLKCSIMYLEARYFESIMKSDNI